jgi:hypothetical protein
MKVNGGTKQEHVEILLFLERRAPVPHTHEAYVDAAPHVVEIVFATPVEHVPEKVAVDLEVQCAERAVLYIDVCAQHGQVVQRWQLGVCDVDGEKDAADL